MVLICLPFLLPAQSSINSIERQMILQNVQTLYDMLGESSALMILC